MEHHPDDVNDLERRLAALAPAGAGLDADRMLFAAGRASVRPAGRGAFWPVVAALLTLVSGGLTAALLNERAEHRALAEQWDRSMRQPFVAASVSAPAPSPLQADETASGGLPAPESSVLASHRVLESGLDGLAAAPSVPAAQGPATSEPPVLRARSSEDWPGL
jgi:hypothetical protein